MNGAMWIAFAVGLRVMLDMCGGSLNRMPISISSWQHGLVTRRSPYYTTILNHPWYRLIEPVLVLKVIVACGAFPTSLWASAPTNW